MGPVLYVAAGVLGPLIGSFLNVVIWRVPRGQSVRFPPSACPGCRARIRARDNIPVLSWLLLRGRCRDCAARISVRYPAVELGTAGLFVAVVARFGGELSDAWAIPAYWYLAAIGMALAWIDVDTHRLPDAIVLPSYPVAVVLLVGATAAAGDWGAGLRALLGGVILLAFYLLLVVVYPAGMGLGDVKLAGVLGLYLAWLGWGALVVGAFAAFLVGGVFAVGLLLARRAGRRSGIPFGPWMILGAAIGIGWGEQLWAAYLGLML